MGHSHLVISEFHDYCYVINKTNFHQDKRLKQLPNIKPLFLSLPICGQVLARYDKHVGWLLFEHVPGSMHLVIRLASAHCVMS